MGREKRPSQLIAVPDIAPAGVDFGFDGIACCEILKLLATLTLSKDMMSESRKSRRDREDTFVFPLLSEDHKEGPTG